MTEFRAALTILICTHNRADLLDRVLASLNATKRPAMTVEILVAANACTDDTSARMRAYQTRQAEADWLPLTLLEVPTPGKSHALNAAIPRIDSALIAFVDDDHRVDENYLLAIEQAIQAWPDAGLYCGRILPDWDGSEPAWAHDEGPYKIYPLPVPRYDQDDSPKTITAEEGPIPGGGNLVVRREVFARVGNFSTELGPHGHDLGGGEDSEYVLRAMKQGFRCQYVPPMVQHHYVDVERLRLNYLLKKSYQRTRSTSRIHGNGSVPLYMWRKLAEYAFQSVFTLSWSKRRFYLVRSAAALGEIQGRRESGHRRRAADLPLDRSAIAVELAAIAAVASGLVSLLASSGALWRGLLPAAVVAALGSVVLLTKSIMDFSQTGPRIREEILAHYRSYSLFALAHLTLWAFTILLYLASGGVLAYATLVIALGWTWSPWGASFAATLGVAVATGLQFVYLLRFNPGLLIASLHYRTSRLYPLWQWATPAHLRGVMILLLATLVTLIVAVSVKLIVLNQGGELIALWAAVLFYAGTMFWAAWQPEARPLSRHARNATQPPNIVMIGSDTLRADRLGALGYHRALTPNIDALAGQGVLFANCYVPCARTAPSLVSLLTGTWPHTHGIRDNFVPDSQTRLAVPALPQLLKPLGYRSAAISDWCGADFGKLSFGFDHTDLPEDQWNLKYFIRQGPKDLRLFLSLFSHNRFGRTFLPEVYYLGGVPLTRQLGRRARRLVSRMAQAGEPFFFNVFYSTTHPPFASEWPSYTRFADPDYHGESKFAMAKLTDPFDILRRQGAPREEFDLEQILDLYDACVAEFDAEVGSMLRHLEASGLADNTLVVVYSDHGMEFFEHDTWGQGNSAIGEASPKIPLVIHDPRRTAVGKIDAVVRSIDLAPTLLELIGAPPVASMDGTSLASCQSNASCPELDAYNETGIWITEIPGLPEGHLRYPDLLELMEAPSRETGTLAIKREYQDRVIDAKDRMIRRGRWKLVYQPLGRGHVLRLFDLENDSVCQHDLSDQNPDIKEELWGALQEFLRLPSTASKDQFTL